MDRTGPHMLERAACRRRVDRGAARTYVGTMRRGTRRPSWAISLIGACWLGLATACTAPVQPSLPGLSTPQHKVAAAAVGADSTAHSLQADTFMRSVAMRDGALGWRQLCPDLQRVVTENAMRLQADSQKAAEVGRIARLAIDFVGGRTLNGGTQIRFYVLTADMTDGSAASRVYIVRSQPAGCVEAVQVEDER